MLVITIISFLICTYLDITLLVNASIPEVNNTVCGYAHVQAKEIVTITTTPALFMDKMNLNEKQQICTRLKRIKSVLANRLSALKVDYNVSLVNRKSLMKWLRSSMANRFFQRSFPKMKKLGYQLRQALIKHLKIKQNITYGWDLTENQCLNASEQLRKLEDLNFNKSQIVKIKDKKQLAKSKDSTVPSDESQRVKVKSKSQNTTRSPTSELKKKNLLNYNLQVKKLWGRCNKPIVTSGDSFCFCTNKLLKRQRYPCYQCTCENNNDIMDLPYFLRLNVFKLKLVNFTGKELRSSINSRLINLHSLHVIGCGKRFQTLSDIDLHYLVNMEEFQISNCPVLKLISINFKNLQISSRLGSINVNNCHQLKNFNLAHLNESSLTNIEVFNASLPCGCAHYWLLDTILNQAQQKVKINVDGCIFRNIKFDIHEMDCKHCKSVCTKSDDDKCLNKCEELYDDAFFINLDNAQSLPFCNSSRDKSTTSGQCSCHNHSCQCNEIALFGNDFNQNVRDLQLNNSTFEIIHNNSNICQLRHLRKLHLHNCCINFVDLSAFASNIALTSLIITDATCEIGFHDHAFDGAILSTIILHKIRLINADKFSLHFIGNRLKHLEMSNMDLQYMLPFIKMLPKLEYLKISKNEIRNLSRKYFAEPLNLKILDVEDNPLDCSCDNAWIHEIISQPVPTLDIRSAFCFLSKAQKIALKYNNPCGICSKKQCFQDDEFCVEDDFNISSCKPINLTAFDKCKNYTGNSIISEYRCDQFIYCTENEARLMTCPPNLFFKQSLNICQPLNKVVCELRKISTEGRNVGFHCPATVQSYGYEFMNRRLRDHWDKLSESSEYYNFNSITEFVEYYGVYVHDMHDCQGYHRCHYDNQTGILVHSQHNRCPDGKFFNTQYDICLDTSQQYMETNPNLANQCRCNVFALQQRYINWYREQYAFDPIILPFENLEVDPCSF
ncbi:hypothetical protein GJ496_002223 [Pomphorhynchus laevis]|nr:hypothetical protein GJ496_002223 [Pomphorhynchus laevis]